MLLAKANGISRRLEFMPELIAMLTTIGSMSATVSGIAHKSSYAGRCKHLPAKKSLVSLFPASLSILLPIILARPVWNIAPPTTKRPYHHDDHRIREAGKPLFGSQYMEDEQNKKRTYRNEV